MSYTKQNWADKTVVTKSGLINMDNQIAANEEAATSQGTRLTAVEALASSASSTATAANTTATALANGTTAAGNANKLGNQLPSYFAAASSLSLNGYGTESGGSNIWDEKWEVGNIATNTGLDSVATNKIRNVAYIEVNANTRYCHNDIGEMLVFFYDSSKTPIQYVRVASTDADVYNLCADSTNGKPFVTPSNCKYIRFTMTSTYGATYLNNIAIIEGTSGSYSPYFASNKHLTDRIDRDFELERFGYVCPIINGIRNFVDSDGVLHRKIARVDLGSFDWTYDSGRTLFRTTNASVISATKNSGNYMTSKHIGVNNSTLVASTDKSVLYGTLYNNNGNIIIHDSAYTTVESFTSAMKSAYLYYELSTEETYSAYDTPSVQSMISDEWQSGASNSYTVGTYRIWQNRLYRCKTQTDGSSGSPDVDTAHWELKKVTDVDRVALQSSTQTSFAELAASVPEGYKYSMQLNITNFTDKPSGITSWFAYCDISASNMSGFVSLILTSNQGMWFGKYGGSSVTWTKID